MFSRRHQPRKRRSHSLLFFVAGMVMAVLFLAMLRPPADRQAQPATPGQAGSLATTTTDRQPRDASAAETRDSPDPAAPRGGAPEQPDVKRLRTELEKSSQENGTLRATIDQLRAELATLKSGGNPEAREQGGVEPAAGVAPAAAAKSPAEGEASRNEAARGENQPARVVAKPVAAATAPPVAAPAAALPPVAPAHVAGQPAKPAASAQHPKPRDQQAKITKNPDNTRDYLAVAREHLRSGSVEDATDALERAETRALNESAAAKDRTVELITRARTELRSGNKANALKTIGAVLQ